MRIHDKLESCINAMLCDLRSLPFYGELCLNINFKEDSNIKTCGVNITSKGMNFYYNSEFLDNLTQNEVNFIVIHEIFHILFDHPKRTISGFFNHKLANIAQDMIINYIILDDITRNFIEIPKDKDGKNMTLLPPLEYKGGLIFEELYVWLRDEREKRKNNQSSQGSQNSRYGPFGAGPNSSVIDTWSLDTIFNSIDDNNGEYLDQHLSDSLSEEAREILIRDLIDSYKSRGLIKGNVESTLNKIRKKKKDYLKYIKRAISNEIFGTFKVKTISKPNRRLIEGIKGKRKIKSRINVVLDTSGSMSGSFERVLSYIYRNDIEINMVQGDTTVQSVDRIKNKSKIDKIKIKGHGGTILQPSINYISDNLNKYNTVVLTDGFTDSLDLRNINGNILIISDGVKVPIKFTNGKVKQIVIEKTK